MNRYFGEVENLKFIFEEIFFEWILNGRIFNGC
jgi:hypothetical protein